MNPVKTHITSVQIFRHGADITRRGTVTLQEGTNRIHISGMSSSADTDTVRLSFPAGISLQDLRFLNALNDDSEKPSDALKEKIEELKQQKETAELQIRLWKDNGDFSSRTQASLNDITDYITALPERLSALQETLRTLNKEIKDTEKELNEAVREESLPVICADIHADKTGTYPFEVHLHENSVSWNPVYEIHTDAEKTFEVRVRAAIFQYTKEDWHNVRVSLLTGNPSRSGELPKIDPVYLSIREPVKARSAMALGAAPMAGMMMKNSVMFEEEDGAVEDTVMMAPMAMADAEVSEETTMTEYALPNAKDIPSDSEGTMADLNSFTLPAEFELQAVPMKSPNAWLIASVDPAAFPTVIKGNTSVYLNGVYSGSAYIDTDMTEEKIILPLGSDESIRLSRIQKKNRTSSALLKNQKNTEYEWEIRITNSKEKELTVKVFDRIPVSQDKTITVDTLNTDKADINAETGILTWKLPLAAKETKVLHNSYRVSWPKDKLLNERTVSGNMICPECGSRVYGRFCPECGRAMY